MKKKAVKVVQGKDEANPETYNINLTVTDNQNNPISGADVRW